jgi:hypothetical protein
MVGFFTIKDYVDHLVYRRLGPSGLAAGSIQCLAVSSKYCVWIATPSLSQLNGFYLAVQRWHSWIYRQMDLRRLSFSSASCHGHDAPVLTTGSFVRRS